MLDKQLHLLLDSSRYDRLALEAKARHVSLGQLVRTAIDKELDHGQSVKQAAFQRLMASAGGHVPSDPKELRKLIDSAHEWPVADAPDS